MEKRIELLMPAGDLIRLKAALLYGADAVFIGGKSFSLRAKASNFTLKDIEEGVKFAHSLNKKERTVYALNQKKHGNRHAFLTSAC